MKRKLKHGARQVTTKPVTLPVAPWDMGALGPANQRDLAQEDAADTTPDGKEKNPNGVTRMRRISKLEKWHNTYRLMQRGRGKGPYITTRQYNAAERYLDAFEATMQAPGWPDNDRVQSSPKPDHAVAIQIDRVSRFHSVAGCLNAEERGIVETVLFGSENMPEGRRFYARIERLRIILDKLADFLE